MKIIIFLFVFLNHTLFSMQERVSQSIYLATSESKRPRGYTYYPFAAFFLATSIKSTFIGAFLYGALWTMKKKFPFSYESYHKRLKKFMTTQCILRGNVVRKEEPSVVVFLGYAAASISLYSLFGYIKSAYESRCLKTLTEQIESIRNKCNNLFFAHVTNHIHNKIFESFYDEKSYLFKNFNEGVISKVQNQRDVYDPQYTEQLSTKEYASALVDDVIAEQGEGYSFCIDFEEKNYDFLCKEHKEKLQFASFFTFLLLHTPFSFLKTCLSQDYLQNMNQKFKIFATQYSKKFSIFCIKKNSKRAYPFLFVTYKRDGTIDAIKLYFSHHIASVLQKKITNPYYAIHTRCYFLKDPADLKNNTIKDGNDMNVEQRMDDKGQESFSNNQGGQLEFFTRLFLYSTKTK